MKNKIDRTKAPFASGIPKFAFPDFHSETLADNSKIFIIEDNSQPLVNIKMSLKKGARAENIFGLAYMSAQLLTKGTNSRPAAKIASEIDLMGSSISANANWDDTSLSISSLSEYFERSVEILADCFYNSEISNDELERLRKRHISNIKQENADPGYLAQLAFELTYFKNHPYGHPLYGSIGSVKSITREDCLDWYKSLRNFSAPFFIVAGNVNKNEAVELLNKYFAKSKRAKENKKSKPEKFSVAGQRLISAINKPGATQATLKLGVKTIGRNNPDYPLLQAVNTIFGGYFLSRLNSLLREKLGYTYGIYSSLQTRELASVLTIGANVNKKHTSDSINKILFEMERINSEPVLEEELARAKQYILGSFVRSVETPRQISSLLYSIQSNGLSPDYYNYYFRKVATANSEEIFEIQKKYFNPENIVVSAAGSLDSLKKQLSAYPNVSYYKNLDEMLKE